MLDTRLAVALVGGACVLAAGTGGYVAARLNAVPSRAVVAADATPPVSPPAADMTGPATIAPVPAAAPAEARRADTPVVRRAVEASRPEPAPRRTARRATPVPIPAASSEPDAVSGREPVLATELPFEAVAPAREIPAAAVRRYEEIVIPADSVIGLQIEGTVSSESARVEDEVEAHVARDVMVGSRVALPTGSRVVGHVTMVERGGKVKERARLGVRFHTVVLPDGTMLPIQTETVFREGDSPAAASTAKIGGGAVGGAVVGAILGGAKGAVIGGTTGAAGGTAVVMAGGRKPATLPGGTTLTVRVLSAVPVTVER